MISEPELIGLLHRADWTKLALSATVTGPAQMLETTFDSGHLVISWDGKRPPFFPAEPPSPPGSWLRAHTEEAAAARTLLVAPGRRYRMTYSGGGRMIGSDGERVWQWFADPPPPGTSVQFDARPKPPAPVLLDPAWLLWGYRLTVAPDPDGAGPDGPTAEVTVAGRPGIRVEGRPRSPGGLSYPSGEVQLWWGMPGNDRVIAVVDAELGFLLRCELYADDVAQEVSALSDITLGESAEAAVFTAPEGSFFGRGGPGGKADPSPVEQFGREAGKLAGGLLAGGLAATAKLTPRLRTRRAADPFALATAEASDPDRAMPDDEPPLPGWARADGVPADAPPVSDELLDLLYRGGLDVPPFSATVHEWSDDDAAAAWLRDAVPPAARQAGFGGVGRLVDTLLGEDEELGPRTGHKVSQLRFGGWTRYRIDSGHGTSWMDGAARKPRPRRTDPVTIACDGERTYQVHADEVKVRRAQPLWEADRDIARLIDGGWLLGHRISGGTPAEVGGQPGYRFIATDSGGAPRGFRFLAWLPDGWLPAAAVADASTGRLLRLTRYRSGRPARLLELRSLRPLGDEADFTFTPPAGLPVKESADPPLGPKDAAGMEFMTRLFGDPTK